MRARDVFKEEGARERLPDNAHTFKVETVAIVFCVVAPIAPTVRSREALAREAALKKRALTNAKVRSSENFLGCELCDV
jgi:hypothetical protein